jgi:SET domain-containing protein
MASKVATSQPYFELRRSRIQGRGAFALRPIPAGTRIIEYTGEIIDSDEADRRYDDTKMKRHHTFLFSIPKGRAIDAAVGGNEARFINHSCDPNCESVEEGDRIFIEAKKSIEPGEELVYDYAYIVKGRLTKEDKEFYKCACGAPTCRGTIVAPPKPKPKAKAAGAKSKTKTKRKATTKAKPRKAA